MTTQINQKLAEVFANIQQQAAIVRVKTVEPEIRNTDFDPIAELTTKAKQAATSDQLTAINQCIDEIIASITKALVSIATMEPELGGTAYLVTWEVQDWSIHGRWKKGKPVHELAFSAIIRWDHSGEYPRFHDEPEYLYSVFLRLNKYPSALVIPLLRERLFNEIDAHVSVPDMEATLLKYPPMNGGLRFWLFLTEEARTEHLNRDARGKQIAQAEQHARESKKRKGDVYEV